MDNYSNITQNLADAANNDEMPQYADVVNYHKEYAKTTLEGLGNMAVGAKAVEGVKVLRSKMTGGLGEKLGINDEDMQGIQDSLESGDYEGALSQVTSKLTQGLTQAGRNLLSGIKSKLGSAVDDASDAAANAANDAGTAAANVASNASAAAANVAGDAATVGSTVAETSIDAASAAASASSTATAAVSDAANVAKTALETATADSAVLDWDPINWFVTAGLGIASLVAGTEIKAHTEKFITPPEIQKNYSVQLDG